MSFEPRNGVGAWRAETKHRVLLVLAASSVVATGKILE